MHSRLYLLIDVMQELTYAERRDRGLHYNNLNNLHQLKLALEMKQFTKDFYF